MAHFIGYLQGSRSRVSRLGTKSSSIRATAQGWDIGGHVVCSYDALTDRDVVEFVVNGGSNEAISPHVVARFFIDKNNGALIREE